MGRSSYDSGDSHAKFEGIGNSGSPIRNIVTPNEFSSIKKARVSPQASSLNPISPNTLYVISSLGGL